MREINLVDLESVAKEHGINPKKAFNIWQDIESLTKPIKMKFRPNHDRILIRPDKDTDTIGSFHLMGKEVEKSRTGEVIAVGPGIINYNIKLDLTGEATAEILDRVEALIRLINTATPVSNKPGDRVIFGQYSGTRVTIEGEQYLIIRESDVMGTI